MKRKTIDSYFVKAKHTSDSTPNPDETIEPTIDVNEQTTQLPTEQPSPNPSVEHAINVGNTILVRDPTLRQAISSYPPDKQDEIVRKYIKNGPYQIRLSEYPQSGPQGRMRRFQSSWFDTFPWLEYSPTTDAAYCFPCFLFPKDPLGKSSCDAFTIQGFKNWKKVGGKDCSLKSHIGKDSNSSHAYSVLCWKNLQNSEGHIDYAYEKATPLQIEANRKRIKASIEVVRWLTFQNCAFRGHDESSSSKNQGNFLEMLKLLASYNKEVNDVVLDNAPQNAKYTSPAIQKEILHVFAQNVQKEIRKEIGDSKFCLIVDESRDISKREQMAIVLRFVDGNGFLRERFFELIHVKDTSSQTLKEEISLVLSNHELSIQNLRGQGYDGASNMRGEWNGLQALFTKDCRYAYYVHCLAHQLQLALIAASREVAEVHDFFKDLIFIVNTVSSSSKRHDELQERQVAEMEHLIEIEEVETGKGLHQIGTLQRPGDTRWSSHYKSICSVLKMFNATRTVLEKIATDRRASYSQRGDAKSALKKLLSFDFVFILHLMQELLRITDGLCRALQHKSQDILNAMHLVVATKSLIQGFRDDGWEGLLQNVTTFCNSHDTQVPDMNVPYSDIIRSRHNKDNISVEHHYRVSVFFATIDQQLQELNSRFSEQATDLLVLSASLNPIDGFKDFNVDNICLLAEKYYDRDFSEEDISDLKDELDLFYHDIPNHQVMKDLSNITDLCRSLVEHRKSIHYPLIYRLIRLILTLPVSTATTERAFSAMKIVKTSLRNKMEDDFLSDYLLVYIEKEIAKTFSMDSIVDDFYSMKSRRVQLK